MKKILIWIIPIIILLAAGGYYFYWKNTNKPFKPTPPEEVKSGEEIKTTVYTNSDHKLTIKYPENWETADLGGEKNINEPLIRENIVFIYDPANLKDKNNVESAEVSAKVLRFISESKDINSADAWFNYVKSKVDDYAANLGQLNNYSLIALDKTEVNGKWAVEEKYYEPSTSQSRDIYIYNKEKNEFYQIITRAPKDLYDQFLPYFDLIINSFKVDN